MKRFLFLPLLLVLAGALSAGCDAISGTEETGGTVQLSGQVLNAQTNNPVPNAVVTVRPYNLTYEADAEGRFNVAVEIDSTMDLQVLASSTGFSEGAVNVTAVAGRTVTVPPLRLSQTVEGPAESGRASNILLLEQSGESIGVKESGSQEVATLTFLVADSVGRPVVLDHSTEIRFSFGAHPSGGEVLAPAAASTDNNGKVTVNLSSGTKAGVVQIIAETTVDGRTIRSKPVALAIHGGLPVLEHLSVAPERYNFPGLRKYGTANSVGVYLGDRYGNPVRPGTAVYFTTSHGIIQGSTVTDNMGQGAGQLISGEPLPYETGIGIVTASTGDENNATISKRVPVLFSGESQFNVDPSCFHVGGNCQVTVTDPYGRPLAEGTRLEVQVEGDNVSASGSASVPVPETVFDIDPNKDGDWSDTRALTGPGRTVWNFGIRKARMEDESGNPLDSELKSVTISVSGPNGNIQETWAAVGAGKTQGANVAIVRLVESDGSVTIRYKE